MESDSSDDEQYDTADNSESDDQMSFHNELNSSSESSDEVSANDSVRGIFKFGKLTSSSKLSEKENEEFQVGKDKEEKASEGDEDVKIQILELNSDQSGETVLHSSDTDSSAKVVGGFSGRDSTDSTEHLKEQEIDSIDIKDDSDMEADEKVETVEEKETLRGNMNSYQMSPSHMRGLEGNANINLPQEANDTHMMYQTDDSLSIKESFVILNTEPTSVLDVLVNETVKCFQEATQIPSLESFEQSFEIIDESFGKPGPIYENNENLKDTLPNSKDTNMTPHLISGNSTEEIFMHLFQSSAEVQKKSLIKRPPPAALKPSIIMEKQEPNETLIQSILIMEDEAPKKTEEPCLIEVEQKQMVRQPFQVNKSAHESSQFEMEMVDIVKQEKEESAAEGNSLQMESFSIVLYEENIISKIDNVKQISDGCVQSDHADVIADAEQRPQQDSKIDNIEQLTQYEKQIGVSVQQTQIESHVNEMECHVNETEQKPQEDTYADDAEERPQMDTQMDKAQRRLLKAIKIETAEESPPDSMDDAEQRSQKDSKVDYAEDDESSKKVSNLMKKFESNLVVSDEDRIGKNAEDGLHNMKSFLGENEPWTHLVHPPVQKRCGTIMLKLYKQSSTEPKSLKQSNSEQFNCEESQLEQSEVPESPLQLYENQKDDKNESKSPNEMEVILPPLTLKNQLHVQQEPDLQSQQERPSFQTLHIQEYMSGSQSTIRHWKPQGSECNVQMPSTSDGQHNLIHSTYGQPNWSTGVSGQPTRQPLQPPWDSQSCGLPDVPEGLRGPYAQYWQPVPSFIPEYHNHFLAMQQGDCQRMNAGGIFNRPPYFASQEPLSGEIYKTSEFHSQHLYQEQKQQHQHQQKQPRSHDPEGTSSANNADPNRKQEEQQKEENKEIEKTKNKQGRTTLQYRKIPKAPELSKISTKWKQYDDVTAQTDKEKRDITSPQRPGQDIDGSSFQFAMRKEEQKEGKGAKAANSGSYEIASEPGYTMVIGLSESTSDDNLLNFMEGISGAGVKEIVFGPRRENAVVIFEIKPDCVHLQDKVSKKKLDDRVLEVFDMPPPTSIILSTKDPKEFSTDTLTFHFESKKYGGAELVEDGIKITEDGCYIMTFIDRDAVERVCTIEHKVENIPLNVSPYYQFKKWTAWNTAIHGINIPKPFSHKVDPVLVRYLQSFPRAMKSVQMTMMEMHAGIELQQNAVFVRCLITPEVKGCRKLVTSWRKDAEESLKKIFFSTFQVEQISKNNMSDIWDDFMDSVKSVTEGKDILLVEERFEDYIQLIGFYEEVKTTLGEILGKKEKLERIRMLGKETMSLKSAATKRLLYRNGIFQRFRTKFSDFDIFFEQSSEEIVLSGVPEDRNTAKLQIYEELRKFGEPVVIQDSTGYFSQFIKEGAPRNYITKEMEANGLMVDWDVSTEKGYVSVYCIPADHAQHAATEMKKMVRETNIPLSESEQLFVTTEEWIMYQAETESKCDGLVHIVVTNDLQNVVWISMDGLYTDILEELKDFIKKNTVIEEMIHCNPITKKFMQAFWDPEDYKEIGKNSRDKHLQLTWQGEFYHIGDDVRVISVETLEHIILLELCIL